MPVAIGGTSWAPEIPQETVIINKLEQHMKNRLEAALEMFCFIARTQMFLDGNKRVAQLMCNKIKHFFREKCLLMTTKWKPVE